jgi:hypothetical protein
MFDSLFVDIICLVDSRSVQIICVTCDCEHRLIMIVIRASTASVTDDFDYGLHNRLIHLRTEISLLSLPLS